MAENQNNSPVKDVIISVQSIQRSTQQNQDPQQVEQVTNGTMTTRNGAYIVSYPECELTGLEGTQTTFEVTDRRITLKRTGTLTSELVFEEGYKHESLYDMGFGALLIGVQASKVHSVLNDDGGVFCMEYTIEIEHELSAKNEYTIRVREA